MSKDKMTPKEGDFKERAEKFLKEIEPLITKYQVGFNVEFIYEQTGIKAKPVVADIKNA